MAAERRQAALEVSVARILIRAGTRASEQLKSTWPRLSAATLNPLVRMIPAILGVAAVATIFAAPGTIVLSIVVALPAAFRIWIVQS